MQLLLLRDLTLCLMGMVGGLCTLELKTLCVFANIVGRNYAKYA